MGNNNVTEMVPVAAEELARLKALAAQATANATKNVDAIVAGVKSPDLEGFEIEDGDDDKKWTAGDYALAGLGVAAAACVAYAGYRYVTGRGAPADTTEQMAALLR